MKPTLQLRLGQSLSMTPQLQQAIKLLQLSTLELHVEVRQALDSNMMLEPDEDLDLSQSDEGEEVAPLDIPSELDIDTSWEDLYEPAIAAPSSSIGDNVGDMEAQHGAEQSLAEQLYWQAELCRLSPEDQLIATAIIDSIDDSGYLSAPTEEILDALAPYIEDIELDQVHAVLRQIQNFEPSGVGARDLQECLLIQLGQLPAETEWLDEAKTLIGDCLDMLGARDFTQVTRMLRLDRQQLQQVMALVQLLKPRPGEAIASKPPEYIVPDVLVSQRSGRWHVELNQEALPKLRINNDYASLIRRADSSPDNTSMRTHLQEARWFIKSLQSRSDTLLRVAKSIVERQREFLELGDEAMKPMVLHDVAEVVGMHESTISRVTTQKYMLTPRGVYELKYFFSSHVSTDSGGEASSTAIRAMLKKLIAAENPGKPLSDSKLAGMIGAEGINVARRTVAKYRKSLLISNSSERKRLS